MELGKELHSFIVIRHGKIACEAYREPLGPEYKHMMYSVSKSFTSCAIGFAVNVNAISKVIEKNGILPSEPAPDVIVFAEEGFEAAAIKQARELREQGFIVENALFTDIESVREYAKEKKICKVVVVDCDSVEDEI
jgi:histidyl-tRNA synthetase